MHTFKELVDLAKSCANIARRTINPEIANYFWRLAMDYQVTNDKTGGLFLDGPRRREP
jgi:hypothetical protein